MVLEFHEKELSGFASAQIPGRRQNVFAETLALRAKELRANLERASQSRHPWFASVVKDFENRFGMGRDVAKLCDVMAQTVAYGFFMARAATIDEQLFSRQVALGVLLQSGNVPRVVFSHFRDNSTPDFVLTSMDAMAESCSDFTFPETAAKSSVYFYESFLAAYAPEDRSQFGVYYTPREIVDFILRGAHATCLEMGFEGGLANARCRIVDPACGSGAFLLSARELLEELERAMQKSACDGQSDCARESEKLAFERSIKKRLMGFEIMPAAYLAAHFHLALASGLNNGANAADERFSVFLTDTLEASARLCESLSAEFQSGEERAAGAVKNNGIVPVVVGNPPYRQFSQNKGPWIEGLMRCYKDGLHEKKHNVDNDYVKFIRFAQFLVEQAGSGVVAFVTPNAFLDAPTLRVMRKSLAEFFDSVRIVNLHGSCTVDCGLSKDENVFGIRQGVCVFFLGRKPGNAMRKELAHVSYAEIVGSRENKLRTLAGSLLSDLHWRTVAFRPDSCVFVPEIGESQWNEYSSFVSVADVFRTKSSGIQTKNDAFVVARTREELLERMHNLAVWDDERLCSTYPPLKDSSGWKLADAKEHAINLGDRIEAAVHPILYRPFDVRHTVVTNFGNGLVGRPRFEIMKNLLGGNSKQNYALITTRQLSSNHFDHAFVAGIPVDGNAISQRSREYNAVFPLFVEDGMYGDVHNFHTSFVQQIEQNTSLRFSEDIQREDASSFGPLDLFGYVYAVLSSGRYRKIYFEFLRRDFARIPTRISTQNFRTMASLGLELANLHRDWMSLEPCPWHGGAYCEPSNVSHDSSNARLYLCSDGYFDEVSPGVLDIRVGAFSVVQKWVSDCVKSNSGGCLLAADLIVLGRILQALSQTVKLTSLIDDVLYPSTSSKMPASTRLRSSSETQEMF